MVTARRREHVDTLLTLRAEDVLAAEILENGVRTGYVRGGGKPLK